MYRLIIGLALGGWVLAAIGAGAPAMAQQFSVGHLTVTRPWSRATPPAATVGVVYLSIENHGHEADRLVSATSPVAGSVEIHETRTSQGMMQMRPVAAVDLPPGRSVRFESGGTHIMLMGLKHALAPNSEFLLELNFDRAGVLRVLVRVGEGP